MVDATLLLILSITGYLILYKAGIYAFWPYFASFFIAWIPAYLG